MNESNEIIFLGAMFGHIAHKIINLYELYWLPPPTLSLFSVWLHTGKIFSVQSNDFLEFWIIYCTGLSPENLNYSFLSSFRGQGFIVFIHFYWMHLFGRSILMKLILYYCALFSDLKASFYAHKNFSHEHFGYLFLISSNSKVSDNFEALHFWLNFVDSLSKMFMHETASSTQWNLEK